jgi:hypothetical protein
VGEDELGVEVPESVVGVEDEEGVVFAWQPSIEKASNETSRDFFFINFSSLSQIDFRLKEE